MSFEVELKFRVNDFEIQNIRNIILSELKGKFIDKYRETDIYLSHPCRNFRETDEALRIRIYHNDNTIEITYKGPKISSDVKTRNEITIVINEQNVDKVIQFFEALGFKKVIEVHKEREVYNVENYTINIDHVKDLGYFIEIETMVNNKEVLDKAIDELKEFCKKLKLNDNRIEHKTYLELILEKLGLS